MYQHAEIVHWMKNQDTMKILPAQVDIDLTNICNQDCYYCNSAEHRAQAPVQKNYQEYLALLDKIASWRTHSPNSYGSIHTITYAGGGEPTLLPNYERVIEHTIDLGFLTSLTTNGSKLEKLIENVSADKIRKMGWIGIDIDAGNKTTYEQIRRSIPKTSPYEKVMQNARDLVKLGAVVDFKILLGEYNTSAEELESIFATVKDVGVRLVYFRPVVMNNATFPLTDQLLDTIAELSIKYGVTAKVNKNKTVKREYRKCHQMFQFPVFCADGKIYLCCESKGKQQFELGAWDEADFRDLWLNERHMEVYNKTRVEFCQPCRPNVNNNGIQKIIDNPALLETLYT